MTQLVELQAATPKFAQAGIKLYAISYDELGALEEFSEANDITFELLSDEGSSVIRQFGILNYHVTEDQVPHHGIPFPGTYLVDGDGIITAKAFHRSLAQRESPEGLIDAALGEILLRSEEPTVTEDGDGGIGFSLTYHGGDGVIRGGQLRRIVVRVDLPDGLHIYDSPVPAGMIPTTFTLVGPDGLRSYPVEKPPTEQLELPGVGVLEVWSGQVDFVIPVWATDEIASLVRGDNPDKVTIELDVQYQACDDVACRLPQSTRLRLDVPVGRYIGQKVAGLALAGADTTTMDTDKWLRSMVKRGLESTSDPEAAMASLQRSVEDLAAGPHGHAVAIRQEGAGDGGRRRTP